MANNNFLRPRAMSASSNGSFQESHRKMPGQSQSGSTKNIPCRHWVTKGKCDLGDDCKFGHIDTYSSSKYNRNIGWPGLGGGGGGGARFPADNAKTVMCKNWTESGSCSYGDKCSFAHSEEQIRSSREQRIIALNPLYKTTLCKQFTEGEYCELGDNCHFAHGQDELRVLRADKVDHSADPLYKTVLCNKWEEVEGSCEYGDSCRFAHGASELRVFRAPDSTGAVAGGGASGRGSISPQYKTVLCNQTDCKFGSESCNFAHTVAELRTVQQNLAEINPNYKGTLCKYYMSTGQCEFGSICQYAHGEHELRRVRPGAGVSVQAKQNYNQSYLSSSISGPQYKTQLCKNHQDSGSCDFGAHCQFAHGMSELRTLSQNLLQSPSGPSAHTKPPMSPVPRGPAHVSRARELCNTWLQTGACPARGACGAAHSLNELSGQASTYTRHFPHSSQDSAAAGAGASKPVKVVLCQKFSNSDRCDKGTACTFAHGLSELHEYRARQVPNYRTTLCQSWSGRGSCDYGDTCMYAHGSHQLRTRSAGGAGADYGMPDSKRVRLGGWC